MKLHSKSLAFLLAISCLLPIVACNRDQQTWDGEITTSYDNNFADGEFSAIRNMMDAEGTSDTAIYGKVSETESIFCPAAVTTVLRTGANTVRLTVDFGSGCNCMDGRLRTGKLIANFTGRWKDAGSTVVITPQNYYVAGYAFAFTATVTVNARDINNHRNWTTVVSNAVLTHPSSGTITWGGNRTTTWIEGEGSTDASTYAYEVTGSASGVARNNLSFSAQVDQPLRVELSCQYIVSGVWSITPQGLEKRSIDYGTSGCDNQATLNIGTFSAPITLP